MKKIRWKAVFKILLGSCVLSLGLAVFLAPSNIVTGGVTGIGIIIRDITKRAFGVGISLSITNLVINIPILIAAWIVKGRRYIARTALATLSLSGFLYLFENLTFTGDILLAAIYGGVLSGIGLGLVFTSRATTGGTDMIAAIIQHYVPHFSVSNFLLIIDGVIVLGGVLVFGIHTTLYALIAVYVTTAVSDRVVDGFHFSKAIYIISDQGEQIAQEILSKIDRGVTGLHGRGMYTSKEKMVLLCTASSKESIRIRRIAHEIDPNAFMIIVDSREVFGEGFIEADNE